MTPPTLTLVANYESSKSAITTIARVSFDGGVEEVAQTEINAVRSEWTVRALLSTTEAESISDFLSEQAGSTPFYWNPQHSYQTGSKLFTCEAWNVEYLSNNKCNVEATLKEWFGYPSAEALEQLLNLEGGEEFNLEDSSPLAL